MSARLSVIFYIILCLEIGIVLTLLPWAHPFGLSDWGDNYFLLLAARKTGLYSLQLAVASGWVRGAVTGLGVLNLAIAAWEMAHFRQTVRALEASAHAPAKADTGAHSLKDSAPLAHQDAAQPATADHLSDYQRRDERAHDPGE